MNFFEETANYFYQLSKDKKQLENINMASEELVKSLTRDGKIIFAGNGGSFADCQHLAAEFIGKLNHDREPLPAICLGTNLSTTTSIGNDYGFELIFIRELIALSSNNDVLVAITTSGESKNIIELLKTANKLKLKTILLTGPNEFSSSANLSDICINTPSRCRYTNAIQQLHIAIGHYLCEITQNKYLEIDNELKINIKDLFKINNEWYNNY